MASVTRQALSLAFNFVAAIAVTLINKMCFARVSFGFPAALSCVHYVITLAGLHALRLAGVFQAMESSPSLRDPQYLVMVVVMGVVTPLNNLSLLLNSVGFYQIFKLLTTPTIVGLEYVLDGKLLSYTRLVCLAVVCLGVFATGQQDLEFSVSGTVAAVVWLPLAAVYKVQWGRLLKRYPTPSGTPAMMLATLPGALVLQMCTVPLYDPPGLSQYHWTPQAVFWITLSGVAAFFVNLSGFLVLENISALAHTLSGQLKTCAIVLGAYLILGGKYSYMQLPGAICAIVAILSYTHFTMKEKNLRIESIQTGERMLKQKNAPDEESLLRL